MSEPIELVVIGAGPAGIEAAVTASQAGVDVTLIDTQPKPGGQYFKQVPAALLDGKPAFQTGKEKQVFQQLKSSKVQIYQNTLVWGIFEGPLPGTWYLKLYGPNTPTTLAARKVILATGAYDRSIPFPGWDLPGVITAGAAQAMIKTQGILPGKRVILTGTGPLQLAAGAHLVDAGAQVVGICECATKLFSRGMAHLTSAWGQWERMKEGVGYIKSLVGGRVPYRLGWAVISAQGTDRVTQATYAKLDQNSRPIPGTEKTVAVDTVVVGYNLTPCTELTRMLECDFAYDHGRGGFVPLRNDEMETSRPGIYAVGDCAGIGGAGMALIEGRIAGYAAAEKLNHLEAGTARQKISAEKRALRKEQHFAQFLGDVFTPSDDLYALADPDTIVCRCEQVTLRQVREAISYGAQTVSDVKNLIRTGMGNCQGRTCGTIIAQILAAETGKRIDEAGYLQMRPPIHPIPLELIEESAQEFLQPDQGGARE